MKKLLTIILVFTASFGFSQTTLVKSSISSGGGSATQGNTYLVYTMGETFVQEADQGSTHLSEGFIGADIAHLLGIEDYAQLEGLKVYPNPVKSNLNIELPEYNNYEIHLFDLTGKELINSQLEDMNNAQFDVSQLKTGVYLLSIIDRDNKKAKTIKVQKL